MEVEVEDEMYSQKSRHSPPSLYIQLPVQQVPVGSVDSG